MTNKLELKCPVQVKKIIGKQLKEEKSKFQIILVFVNQIVMEIQFQ